MTSTTTPITSQFALQYQSDNDSSSSDSEDELIQRIPDKFKNEDFTEKLTSNTNEQLSTNIVKWVRNYEQKYIQRRGSKGKLLVRPRLQTRYWSIVRYIVNDVKYSSLSRVKPVSYPNLVADDLLIILQDRDTDIKLQRGTINGLYTKVSNLEAQLRYAWSRVFNKHT